MHLSIPIVDDVEREGHEGQRQLASSTINEIKSKPGGGVTGLERWF